VPPAHGSSVSGGTPADLPELAAYLDSGAGAAEALSVRGQRLDVFANSRLRLTPRLRDAIADASDACALAADAVSALPGTLRADLDV
jgi:hypothetical protein